MFNIYLQLIQANLYLSLILLSSLKKIIYQCHHRSSGKGKSQTPHPQLQSHLQLVPESSENWPGLAEIPFWRKHNLRTSTAVLEGAVKTSMHSENRCFFHLPITRTCAFPQSACWDRGSVWDETDIVVLPTFALDLDIRRSCSHDQRNLVFSSDLTRVQSLNLLFCSYRAYYRCVWCFFLHC